MNNTALRAKAQSANNTHMVFANEEHDKFYYEKLEQARHQDCYHKSLIYILGISEDTRNHFSQIYDMEFGRINNPAAENGNPHGLKLVAGTADKPAKASLKEKLVAYKAQVAGVENTRTDKTKGKKAVI